MDPSSPPTNKPLPEGVSEADLVEGPKVAHFPSGRATFTTPMPEDTARELIKPIPAPAPPYASSPPPPEAQYLGLVNLALDVLAARLHALVALVAACALWGTVMWAPDVLRITAAGIFSALVFLPTVWTWWWAGLKGEK